MANVTITVPDAFIALYNQRRATWNIYATATGNRQMPPATAATLQRFMRDYMKGLIRNESARLDAAGADDGTIINADDAAVAGV